MLRAPVLVLIDVQQGFRDEEYWGSSANPECLGNIERLLTHWRQREWPIAVVKHNSQNPASPLNSQHPGNQLEPFVEGSRDVLIQKSVNSAFYGTPSLALWLDKRSYRHIVIAGITTNQCCETTARMAGNLGYKTDFVIDATAAFDRKDVNGEVISGQAIMRTTAANLHGEFANVVTTAQLLSSF